jgi:PAS domain S-box-containing protein
MLVNHEAQTSLLVLAPLASDAASAGQVLRTANLHSVVCSNLFDLAARIQDSTDAILITEEALVVDQLPSLLDALSRQPTWSDIPIVLLTSGSRSERMTQRMAEIFGRSANITLLERPFHAATLLATVQAAVRARKKQRQVRDLLFEREAILSGISDAFSALDRNWRYTFVNDNVARMAGIPKERMIGRVIWEIFPEAVGGEFFERSHKAMATQKQDHFETYYKPWKRWLDTRLYPTESGLVIFRADITQRKEQEEQLKEKDRELHELQERARLAVEAADVGTFDYDALTKEIRWSSRCYELFGLAAHVTPTYRKYIQAIHPEDRHIVYGVAQRILEPGCNGRYDIEYRVIGPKDRKLRWLSEKGRATFDINGHAIRFIGTILDITEAKHAALALERAKEEAEKANSAKDQFLAMLSHELRTPLTPVLMTLNALQKDPGVSKELLGDLKVLQRNVELEALLIDDLLDLNRISHGKLQLNEDVVDIHSSLEQALAVASAEVIAKNLKIIRCFEAAEYHSRADAARLQQVFWNLIKNAVKFTDAEGSIEIRTQNDKSHNIVIEIADKGAGIAPELQPKIFDAFEQGARTITNKHGGLGLGLAISKRIIDLHGGTISVSSLGEGCGSTFTIKLKAIATSAPIATDPVIITAHNSSSAHILLLEDHEDTRYALSRILERAGYRVSQASTIGAANSLVAKEMFDVVISDVGLPDGSGLDFMKRLQNRAGLRGIALSGFGMEEDRAASKAAGFAEHFTKPVNPDHLRQAIERLRRVKSD